MTGFINDLIETKDNMDLLNNQGLAFLTIISIAGISAAGGFQAAEILQEPETDTEGEVEGFITQKVSVTHYKDRDSDGEYEDKDILLDDKKNLLVDQGRNFYQYAILGNGAPNGEVSQTDTATYIALSNESEPEADDTFLQGEFTSGGMSRTQCTGSNLLDFGVGNASCSASFTATSDFNNVNMSGLMWNNTDGSNSLVAEVNFTSANVLENDQIVANYTRITFEEK